MNKQIEDLLQEILKLQRYEMTGYDDYDTEEDNIEYYMGMNIHGDYLLIKDVIALFPKEYSTEPVVSQGREWNQI